MKRRDDSISLCQIVGEFRVLAAGFLSPPPSSFLWGNYGIRLAGGYHHLPNINVGHESLQVTVTFLLW